MNQKTDTDAKTESADSLKNHFLVAMPGLRDPNFIHSVVYICEHGPEGAMGLVINHPTDIPFSQLFDQFEATNYTEELGRHPVLIGGPIQNNRGFVLHPHTDKTWESTLEISPQVCLTSSKDIITDIAAGLAPENCQIVLGYSGWGAGQLESELVQNSWLVIPASDEILFKTPYKKRASAASSIIGVDLDRLSNTAGHA